MANVGHLFLDIEILVKTPKADATVMNTVGRGVDEW